MMKRVSKLCAAVLALTLALAIPASASAAADYVAACYPTSVTRSEDGTVIRKIYDLSPEDDPAGIPRSDFEQDGFHYTLTDLLRQEAPTYEERSHTETVSVASQSKDMGAVLALLPQEREFITEDGLTGILTLKLDTANVEVAGYGSSTKEVSATRSYPNLDSQDTASIPKTIEDGGTTYTLQSIDWQMENSAVGERWTAVATYSGSTTSSYVKGYTVTADYVGTVSRINLNKVRYVAIFERTPLLPLEPVEPVITPPEPDTTEPTITETPTAGFNWAFLLVPLGLVAAAGGGIGIALFLKRRSESEEGAA